MIGMLALTEVDTKPYVDMVERAGGVPRLICVDSNGVDLEKELKLIDGLILFGDSFESTALDETTIYHLGEKLLKYALSRDIPVLGIGAGIHLLNLVFGGSLSSDVNGHQDFDQDGNDISAYHRIYISPGSKLAAIVGSGGFVRVNSRHKFGIRESNKSSYLLASAYSLDDGVIEGLESPDHTWVIGVQFHPERRMELPPHFERLFQSFIERVSE